MRVNRYEYGKLWKYLDTYVQYLYLQWILEVDLSLEAIGFTTMCVLFWFLYVYTFSVKSTWVYISYRDSFVIYVYLNGLNPITNFYS